MFCAVFRHPSLGHLCGYVAVAPGHPLFGKGYDDPATYSLDCHGGLTFAEPDDKAPRARTPATNGMWWFGFDAGHSGDRVPATRCLIPPGDPMNEVSDYETYRDFAYMRQQVIDLAKQLSAVKLAHTAQEEKETK